MSSMLIIFLLLLLICVQMLWWGGPDRRLCAVRFSNENGSCCLIIRIDRQLAAKASGFCFLLLFFSGISRAAEDPVALFEAGKYE